MCSAYNTDIIVPQKVSILDAFETGEEFASVRSGLLKITAVIFRNSQNIWSHTCNLCTELLFCYALSFALELRPSLL